MAEEQLKPKHVQCTGQPALLWVCSPEAGGCGARGAIAQLDAVKHWARGGMGQINCGCGAIVNIGKGEERRIVTPHEAMT